MKIRKYTLNFVKLGKPINNQYPIYLRYYYTLNHKKHNLNVNCDNQLSIDQFQLLNNNKLNTSVGLDLLQFKKNLEDSITFFYVKSGEFPDTKTLKEFIKIRSKEFSLKSLIRQFLETFQYKVKNISVTKYKEQLKHLQDYVSLNHKNYKTFDDLVSERTINDLEKYLDSFHLRNKIISNNSFKSIISISVRFINFVAKQYDISPIDYKVKIPLLSEKIHIIESEFLNMVNYNVEDSGLRKDHKDNLKKTQDLVYINSHIGLRINELLNLKKSNIIFNGNYLSIKFYEQKKNDIRNVLLIDEKAIRLITIYFNSSNTEYLFNLYVNVFNNNLKTLAKLAEMTDEVEYIKNYRMGTVTLSKPKWELISSHAIRRYAVNRNVAKYGIDVARQYSGHKDYATIKNNYMRNINDQDLLNRIQNPK